MVIATNIKTDKWNEIIQILKKEGWKTTYKYDNFDAGIDFDFIRLERKGEKILLAWDNWFEGEIKCTSKQLEELENQIEYELKLGKPENLKQAIILMYDRPRIKNLLNIFKLKR